MHARVRVPFDDVLVMQARVIVWVSGEKRKLLMRVPTSNDEAHTYTSIMIIRIFH